MVAAVTKKAKTNVKRLSTELPKLWDAILHKKATHWSGAYVNKFVEAAKASPYAMGHIDAVLYPVGLIALAAAVVL